MIDLIARIKAWRKRRYWHRLHLEFLRTMINEDWRWLGVHPIGMEITNRYHKAASESWYMLDHEPIDQFRRRIGMDPHDGRRAGREDGNGS